VQYCSLREWIQSAVLLEISEMQLFLPHRAFIGDANLCIVPQPHGLADRQILCGLLVSCVIVRAGDFLHGTPPHALDLGEKWRRSYRKRRDDKAMTKNQCGFADLLIRA
jgi:hypothetical protein